MLGIVVRRVPGRQYAFEDMSHVFDLSDPAGGHAFIEVMR